MKEITNKFGTGKLYNETDFLFGDIYATCTACMSIWAEYMS